MKTFWSWLAKILLVLVVIEGWFLYDMYTKNEQLISNNVELEKELLASKESLSNAEERIAELEKNSLEGMLEETNKAVVSGWEKLLDAVEDELQKARTSINSTMDGLQNEQILKSKPKGNDPSTEGHSKKAPSAESLSPDSEKKSETEETNSNPESIKGERT